MPRKRSIYSDDFLYVGPTPSTGQHFSAGNIGNNLISGLYRIQSINYGKSVTHTDLNQFGELARIDSIILDSPTTTLDANYLSASLWNEKILGLKISSGSLVSCISGILAGREDDKNYFIRQAPIGDEVVAGQTINDTNLGAVIGIGNGFLSSYSAEGSVGALPTVSFNVEGLGWKVDTTTGKHVPSVNPTDGSANSTWIYTIPQIATSHPNAGLNISAIRPGDIEVLLGTYDGDEVGADTTDMKIQSYNVSFDLSRTSLQQLGTKFAVSREVSYPVSISASFTANVGDMQSGNYVAKVNADASYDLTIKQHRPNTTTRTDATVAVAYIIKGAKLDSETYSSSIGPNKSVTLNFTSQVAGPNSQSVGLFLSGLN